MRRYEIMVNYKSIRIINGKPKKVIVDANEFMMDRKMSKKDEMGSISIK